jgi:hypothetical protein
VPSLDSAIAWFVYGSVALGAVFLAVARTLVPGFPDFLWYSILGGEIAYLVCAITVALKVRGARYFALGLAILTLAVSLPQPEHYSFAETGQIAAFLIFSGGTVLQVLVIISVALRAIRRPKAA